MATQEKSFPTPWRKSSASGHTECVEVQFERSAVRVRNSRRPDQTVEFTNLEWEVFVAAVRDGEFSHA